MNIDMIEVMENDIKFIIFPKKEKVLIGDKYYPITMKEIEKLIRIIRNWYSNYNDNSYFDGNIFSVSVHHDGKVDKFRGIRGVPSNYQEFIEFVRDIYDRR